MCRLWNEKDDSMGRKRYKPEEIVGKLRLDLAVTRCPLRCTAAT